MPLLAEAVGESVPPKLIDFIAEKINLLTEGKLKAAQTRLV